jgi:hypothetical protein
MTTPSRPAVSARRRLSPLLAHVLAATVAVLVWAMLLAALL